MKLIYELNSEDPLLKKLNRRAKILVACFLAGIVFVVFVLTQVISHYIDVLVGVGG